MKLLSKKIVSLLRKKKIKISSAESCTGGLFANTITSISGASKVYTFGLVTYSNQSKINLLKIPKKTLIKYGAVSKQVCFAMVKNLSKISKTDIAVSITGIAGPKGGSKNKPVGLVYIGIKKANKIIVNKYILRNKNRSYIQRTTVNKSLKLILSVLK